MERGGGGQVLYVIVSQRRCGSTTELNYVDALPTMYILGHWAM